MFVRKRRNMRLLQFGILIAGTIAVHILFGENSATQSNSDRNLKGTSINHRHILQYTDTKPNCTPRAVEQFPRDVFTMEQRRKGAIMLHIFVAIYMFLGFALLCDDYFVPSLEVICDVLHIEPDVAGATFMAAGSSAPELATAVIAVFIAKDDIGLGTVVGSAVYNVMFVISICSLFAGMVVPLNWWPLFRDCLFYTISVSALAFVIMDEKVYWYEASLFIILYMLYILLMYFNKSLEDWLVPKFSCCASRSQSGVTETYVLVDRQEQNGSSKLNRWTESSVHSNGSIMKETMLNGQGSTDDEDDIVDADSDDPFLSSNDESHMEEPESVFKYPDTCWKRVLWVFAIPLKFVFYITIPDCRLKSRRKYFIVTFTMSLVWLSVLSYIMVWMITIIGYTAGIADTIMGLTFIAFGVSLPDVISSLIVVREGKGDMAVSNAVGSNVFDILICLGVPWMLQTIIKNGRPVQVYSEGLLYATFTLLATVLFLLVSTHINRWRLTKKFGAVLMVVYVLFTVLTALYELNIFGYVHPTECVSTY